MVSNSAWAVPLAKPAASMLNLVLPLQRSAWVSVLVTACVIWLVARFWAGLSGSKAFVDAVSTMLGASSGSLKTAPRLAVIGIRIGCFILAASYQSQLSSILTVPVFEQQIETPTQLISSSHKLYKLCFNQRILVEEQDQRLPPIERRTETVGRSSVMGVLRQVAEGGAAFLGPDLVLERMVRADPYLKRHIFVMKRIESFLPVAFLTRRGDPLSGRIDSLIGHLNAAGLLVKWERDVLRGPSSADGNKWPAGHVKIRLSHLTGAFLLWIIGLLAAFSAFLFEVAF
ncbi:uncharacterized protein LOC135946216 [Cloeon dipterum]|uniref:uncharacterized protein LOC135946216 n=1 Tax=Cloeon dipterum TaxID=197152 RepID=UPI00322098D0